MQLFLAALVALSSVTVAARTNLSDEEIRQWIIQDSIASYRGNCPCPYNITRNGSQCGGRSAYSKPGGASPICYPADVSNEMPQRYKSNMLLDSR